MAVEFIDNSVQVKDTMADAIAAFLEEASGLLEAQTKRNTNPPHYGKHDVKNSWSHVVDDRKQEAMVGSPMEAAFWSEFGTGEHALHKDGRKGWWVYVEGNDNRSTNQKYYTEEEAKATAARMRAMGLDAHATNGSEPVRPLHTAFTSSKTKIKKRLEETLQEKLK